MLETPKAQHTGEKPVTTVGICDKLSLMDNQQARARRLGWLVGIVDGEGCLSICAHQKDDKRTSLRPLFSMSMTEEKDVIKFVNILNEYGVTVKSYRRKPPRMAHYREQWGIYVTGFERVRKLIELVIDELSGKKEQAELMLEWIARRQSLPKSPGAGRSTFSELDWSYKNRLTDLKRTNRSGTSLRDYTPSTVAAARERIGKDIVRTVSKDAEVASRQPAYCKVGQ